MEVIRTQHFFRVFRCNSVLGPLVVAPDPIGDNVLGRYIFRDSNHTCYVRPLNNEPVIACNRKDLQFDRYRLSRIRKMK